MPDDDSVEWRDATGTLAPRRADPARTTGRGGTSTTSRTPGRIKVASIVRSNQPRIDVATLIGQEDDVVQFVVLRDALVELDERLAKAP